MRKYTAVIMLFCLTALCAVVWGVYWVSGVAWSIVLANALAVSGILLTCFTIGYLPIKLLIPKFGLSERFILAWALGAGVLAIIILLAGLAGLLWAPFWRGLGV